MAETSFALKLATIANFDENFEKDFDAQLASIVADCKRRPACGKKRTLTLKLECEPNENDSDDVDVAVVVSSKIPAAEHRTRRARSTRQNQLLLDFEEFGAVGEDGD